MKNNWLFWLLIALATAFAVGFILGYQPGDTL